MLSIISIFRSEFNDLKKKRYTYNKNINYVLKIHLLTTTNFVIRLFCF